MKPDPRCTACVAGADKEGHRLMFRCDHDHGHEELHHATGTTTLGDFEIEWRTAPQDAA